MSQTTAERSDDLMLQFPTGHKYAFLYEDAHLLMITFDRDDAKFLFLIQGQSDGSVQLEYPGELFTNQVLDAIQSIFFIQVNDDEKDTRYALGSFFLVDGIKYGAYYEREVEQPSVVLFRLDGDAPDFALEVPDEDEFAQVSAVFTQQHQDFVDIRK